jgi:hypothetical protein
LDMTNKHLLYAKQIIMVNSQALTPYYHMSCVENFLSQFLFHTQVHCAGMSNSAPSMHSIPIRNEP